MCGIAGFFAGSGAPGAGAADAMLQAMQSALLHRGPDGRGLWLDPARTAGLAHVRLATLDPTPAGAQPMWSPDGRFVLSFNGEIYNFHALRDELRGRGCVFRTNSDTEVLLELLRLDGHAALPRLRGMFAFALWDAHARRGLLARDGFGIKPLYYSVGATGLVFASELRAMLAASGPRWRLDAGALAGFFTTGSVPDWPGASAAGPPKPSPAARARRSARASHHSPKPSITAEAMMPSPGAANGVVPKNGIGIAFWIAGVPGIAVIVKVVVPSATAGASRRFGMSAARNSACPIGAMTNMATNRLTPP